MTSRYFVAIPGSTEPPNGPLAIGDIEAQYRSGALSKEASICKVGDSTWVDVASVFPVMALPLPPVVPPPPRTPAPSDDRFAPEADRYRKLTRVADGAIATGGAIEFLGIAIFAGGILGAFFALSKQSPYIAGALAAAGVLVGPAVYSFGILVAAIGEALLALRDIAINTRITAEAAR